MKGGTPPVDPSIFDSGDIHEKSSQFMNDSEAQKKFKSSISVRELLSNGDRECKSPESNDLSRFSAVLLCGGHGCVDDFVNNDDIKDIVEFVYSIKKGCIGAICHGPLGLSNCKHDGKLILAGKFVAAFSNEEEEILGLSSVLPVLTEDVMDRAGAVCVPAEPWL